MIPTDLRGAIRWVVFDLDDTLYLERDYVFSGFDAVSRYLSENHGFNYDALITTLSSDFRRGVRGNNLELLIDKFNLPGRLLTDLIRIYRTHKPRIKLLDGVPELLMDLRKRVYLAVITDGHIDSQKAKVEALGLDGIFKRIIFTDEFGRDKWKPSVFAFDKLKELEGIGDNEGVYVGDNPSKDFEPAAGSGFSTIRISHPGGFHSSEPDMDGCEPDYRAGSVKELEVILDAILPGGSKAIRTIYAPPGKGTVSQT